MDDIVKYIDNLIDYRNPNDITYQIKALYRHLELIHLEQIQLVNASECSIHFSYILALKTYFSKKISCDHQVILNMFLEIHSKYYNHRTILTNSYIEYLLHRLQHGKFPEEKICIIIIAKRLIESQIYHSNFFLECKEKLSILILEHILNQNLIDSPKKIEDSTGFHLLSGLFISYLPEFDFDSKIQEIFIKYYKVIKTLLINLPGKIVRYNNTLSLLSLYSKYSMMLSEENNIRLTKISRAVFSLGIKSVVSDNLKQPTQYRPARTFEELKENTRSLIDPFDIDPKNHFLVNPKKEFTRMLIEEKNTVCKTYTLVNEERKIESISNEIYALELTSSHKNEENCFISYYGWFFDQQKFVISMEDAGDNLSSHKPLFSDESSLKRVFEKLVFSFHELKLLGILHCDIKPENITFTKNLEPKIIDYGGCIIAKKLDKKREYNVRGTRVYSSPQLCMVLDSNSKIKRLRIDYEKSDVFSLGMVFLELASQESCLKMNDPSEHSQLIKKVNNLNLQPELRDIIKSMLDLDSNERPCFLEILNRISLIK